MNFVGWIFLAVLAVLVLWAISVYNGLVVRRNRYRNAYAQIDVQLKRRHDLIPNMVETARGYMRHERETLDAVVHARNAASGAAQIAAASPGSEDAIHGVEKAEVHLNDALGRFYAVAEAYPDLKANETMKALQEELTSTENRVAFARQAYNDSVMEYNTRCESFPDNVFAAFFKFAPAQLLQSTETPAERTAPQVSF
ncbi:MAG TPA: LemA family protein [Usitatibacter sp.]|nr:LemA family protein [Usitatibacter sp.]